MFMHQALYQLSHQQGLAWVFCNCCFVLLIFIYFLIVLVFEIKNKFASFPPFPFLPPNPSHIYTQT